MVKQRSLGPDNMEDGTDPSSAFLDALRTRAMDEMHEASLEYGIVLKDLAVIDRQFKGEIASTMDKLTTRALQAQVEAANVDRENSNKVKQEEGQLSVARIKAQSRNVRLRSYFKSIRSLIVPTDSSRCRGLLSCSSSKSTSRKHQNRGRGTSRSHAPDRTS